MRRAIWIALLLISACAPAIVQPVLPTPTRRSGLIFAPAPEWADLAPYHAALRPEFANDLERFMQATQYRIDLRVSDDLRLVNGRQTVHYVNTENVPLDVVYFRLFPNTRAYAGSTTITTLRLNGAPVEPHWELGNSALRLEIDPPLPPSGAVDFDLVYVVTIPSVSNAVGYNQFGLYDGVLTLPNVYPIIPVYDEEGWNVESAPNHADAVYSDTALYQVTITAPADQVLATSGVCQMSDTADATKTWRCAGGPMRDFMVAMSAGYRVESTQVDGVTLNSYFLEEDAEAGRRGLRHAADALLSFQRRIGPYPFAELDLLETPTTAGGIEYPGLIVVTQEAYRESRTLQEAATVHEVAHQWWYSLVGNDQVDEPWLDEALTQYTGSLYYHDVYGDSAAETLIDQDFWARYRRALDDGEDLRADLPAASYSSRQYSRIVYGKAALFFDALYRQMGDERFNAFLRAYFDAHRYSIAQASDLLNAAAAQLDRAKLDALLRQWITTPKP